MNRTTKRRSFYVLVLAFHICGTVWQANSATLQQTVVTGKVSSSTDGALLPGVSIIVKGTNTGTTTDEGGNYRLAVSQGDVLVFSFVGFESQEVQVGNQTEIHVILQEGGGLLDEVTVVAFGTQKKESVVSSITTIAPKDLKVPTSNLTTALAGRISGLISYQRSGEPGVDNADFFIRGVTTFGYTASPLILIDGLEMRGEDLARMQPDDIASFSILKDASATSLYGSRGANGVILVTTKEGVEGKVQVSVRYEKSVSAPTQSVEFADPVSYMRLHNEAVVTRDRLAKLPYTFEKIESTEAGINPLVYPATDWHDMLFKPSTINDRVNLSLGGGGKAARYYVAATFNQDNGVLKVDPNNNFNSNINLKKYLLRSNVNINATPSTEAVVRLHATFDDYTGPLDGGAALYDKVMHSNPVLFPAFYPPDEGEVTYHTMFGNYDNATYLNPYADLMKGYKDYATSLMMAQFELKQNFDFLLKGLKMHGLYSTTRYSYFDVQRFYNPFYYNVGSYNKLTDAYTLTALNEEAGTEYLGYTEGAKQISANSYLQTSINYDRVFGGDHAVGGLMVFYMRNQLVGNAGSLQNSLAFRNMGLSGRGTYGYKERYYLEANFGYNGSERFSKQHRFGFFPSFGIGWVLSNENFWKESTLARVIPYLKFRATTGFVGNDAIGSPSDRFFHLSQVNMDDESKAYTFGSEFQNTKNGITITRYANEDISWETAQKTNLGFELNLFDVLNFNADVYQEHRSNILMNRAFIPKTLGLQSVPRANVGEAEGRGIDLSLDFDKNFASGLWFVGRANFTYATSEFKVFEEPDYSETPWKSRIGHPLSQTWGYVAERLFVDEYEVRNSPQQAPDAMAGDIKYKDINGDGVINELDQVPIGFPTIPEIIYGAGFSTGYRSFDLSCFFQGLGRESFWIDPVRTAPFANNSALLKVYEQSHWSEEDRDLYALWPRLSGTVNMNNTATSTWFMRNGAFLRLKSVELGYTMPAELTRKIGVTKARWYVVGMNLMTFSSFDLWDPEMAGNGLGYPVQRVVNAGLQVSF